MKLPEQDKQNEEVDEVVEVDENGNIRNSKGKLLRRGKKRTILRDPEGEY